MEATAAGRIDGPTILDSGKCSTAPIATKLRLIVNRALSHHKHVAPLTNLAAQLHRGGRGYPLQLFGGRSKVRAKGLVSIGTAEN